jgi:hypothetical protein
MSSSAQTFIGQGPLDTQVKARGSLWRRGSPQPYVYTQEMDGKWIFTAGGSEYYPLDATNRIGASIALKK